MSTNTTTDTVQQPWVFVALSDAGRVRANNEDAVAFDAPLGLALLADGMTDREISVALVVSRRTVESHVRNILEKLGVQSRLDAARIYRRRSAS